MNDKFEPETRHCQYCGTAFEAKKPNAKFCSASCRRDHNNTRAARGAIIYDLLMETRFNRGSKDANELRSLIYSLVAEYRAEDKENGRNQSWNDPREWLAANPWIKSPRLTVKSK